MIKTHLFVKPQLGELHIGLEPQTLILQLHIHTYIHIVQIPHLFVEPQLGELHVGLEPQTLILQLHIHTYT